MPYTAIQELDLIKENKLRIIAKINEKLGKDSGLTWDSSWEDIKLKIDEIRTFLPVENTEVFSEIENLLTNTNLGNIKIWSNKIVDRLFQSKTSLVSMIANNTTIIGNYSFSDCNNLTTIELQKLCDISNYAFFNCSSLENIDFSKVKTIGSYSFSNCSKLNNIDLTNCTRIGDYAFSNCSNIGPILYLNNSGSVDTYAFNGCTSIEEIIITDTKKQLYNSALTNINNNVKWILCEAESKPSNWGDLWNSSNYPVYWNAKLRNYTFVLNNGEADVIKQLRIVTESDLPIIERQGYIFDSWYTDENRTNPVDYPYISTTKTRLFANWLREYSVILVTYDTYEQIPVGTYNYSDLGSLPDLYFDGSANKHYATVGAYLDPQCNELIHDLTMEEVPNPVLYIKVVPSGYVEEIKNFEYSGGTISSTLYAGKHFLECWGAQGGNGKYSEGGRGGYSCGELTLESTANIYINVGGAGSTNIGVGTTAGGFNGGGLAKCVRSNTEANVASGGGSSDIRLEVNSLYSRLIVAGGGGGGSGGYYTTTAFSGAIYGWGGGTNAAGQTQYDVVNGTATGASQTAGGVIGYTNGGAGTAGTFGLGGGATNSLSTWQWSGGGGGWYGGAGGCFDGYAGGGSGYVYSADTTQYYPTGCLLDSNYYLKSAKTIGGNLAFNSPVGGEEIGHTGNGYIRITSKYGTISDIVGIVNLIGITNSGDMVELDTLSLTKNIMEGTLPELFAGWAVNNWYTNIDKTIELTYPYEIKLNDSITLYASVSERITYDFEYTGDVQELIFTPGKYLLECWGAQGGDGVPSSNPAYAGRGGYTKGILELSSTNTCYIYVGGKGKTGVSTKPIVKGGFNGGGDAGYTDKSVGGGSGGGASDIRIGTDSLYARVIVAGGGGGGGESWSSARATGGAAGGETGYAGRAGGTNTVSPGTNGWGAPGAGGSQTTGGASGKYSAYSTQPVNGGFGYGANGIYYNNSGSAGGGGGGGWYGGGAGINGHWEGAGAGGGGSSYVYTQNTADYYPAGCLLDYNYYLTNTTLLDGNQSFLSPTGETETGHNGNGHVRITKIRSDE